MPFTIHEKADEGANAVLYKGDDGLDRTVAIKLISASCGDPMFVLDQAKALARVKSPHVVEVIVIEEFDDPSHPGTKRPGIVMEWLDGHTLQTTLAGPLLTLEDCRRIGIGLIDGLRAIHEANLAHTDLHHANVMVGPTFVKILDIQYYDSLNKQSGRTQAQKLEHDRNMLRDLLNKVLNKAHTPADKIAVFNMALAQDDSLDSIRSAFDAATNPDAALDLPKQLERFWARVTDPVVVDSPEYDTILADSTPDQVIRPLIEQMIGKAVTGAKHSNYLRAIWSRLSPGDRSAIGAALGEAFDGEVPGKNFGPHVHMLTAFGETGWNSLPPLARMRLEKAMLDDMGQGSFHYVGGLGSGALGTWVTVFHPFFSNQKAVLEKTMHLLRVKWGGQNYLGQYFMLSLPHFPKTQEDLDSLLNELASAYDDKPYIFVQNMGKLPGDWQSEIYNRSTSGPPAPPPPPFLPQT